MRRSSFAVLAYLLARMDAAKKGKAMNQRAAVDQLREAAGKIKHWHDVELFPSGNGMVVSQEAVFELWAAVDAYDKAIEAQERSYAALERRDTMETPNLYMDGQELWYDSHTSDPLDMNKDILVGRINKEGMAAMPYVIHAVNSHDALVAACEAAMGKLLGKSEVDTWELARQLEAALAAAGKG